MERSGRVALVTGGARRLGRAMALALAADGARVLVHYNRSAEQAGEVVEAIRAAGGEAEAFGADLRDRDAVTALFDRLDEVFGRLDLLVNNASVFERTPWDTLDEESWALHLDVNLTGPFRVVRHAAPRLASGGGGLVVNLVDASGFRPWRDYLAHSVSKAGLIALTKGLARELAPSVRVNAICPGPVLWPETEDEASKRKILTRVPLGRAGGPEDVVRALRYLVAADYVTGEVLQVEGGRLLT